MFDFLEKKSTVIDDDEEIKQKFDKLGLPISGVIEVNTVKEFHQRFEEIVLYCDGCESELLPGAVKNNIFFFLTNYQDEASLLVGRLWGL